MLLKILLQYASNKNKIGFVIASLGKLGFKLNRYNFLYLVNLYNSLFLINYIVCLMLASRINRFIKILIMS